MSLQGTYWVRTIQISASFAELKQSVGLATEQLGFQYFLYRGRFPDRRTKVRGVSLAFDIGCVRWKRQVQYRAQP